MMFSASFCLPFLLKDHRLPKQDHAFSVIMLSRFLTQYHKKEEINPSIPEKEKVILKTENIGDFLI